MLHWVDAVIIVVYLLVVIAVGILCRGRQADTDDYFTAGGGLGNVFGSVLVGLSIAATLFSGISLLAYPSMVYKHGLDLLVALAFFPFAWLILRTWFLPRYLANKGRHPYDILECHFGPSTRTVAAAMFVLLRVGWMAALIYAPTVAVLAAGKLDPQTWFWPLVLAIGISSTIYTTLGGIRGVIITDAIQFLIIAVGIGLTVGYVLLRLPVSLGEAFTELGNSGHLQLIDTSLDPRQPLTVWAILIGVTVANLGSYLADQMSLQRYLASGGVRAASRSFGINVIGVVVVLTLLVIVGMALRTWYQHVPDDALPASADQIFPHFISTQLPVGLAGLLLAAILAATMSSMTSGINALAGTITLDFRERLGSPMSPAAQLRYARACSCLVGLLATVVAGFVDRLGDIFSIAQTLLGVFLGPLLACMILAVAQFRVGERPMIGAMVTGCVAGWVVVFSEIAALWVAPAAFLATLTVVAAAAAGRLLRDAAGAGAVDRPG